MKPSKSQISSLSYSIWEGQNKIRNQFPEAFVLTLNMSDVDIWLRAEKILNIYYPIYYPKHTPSEILEKAINGNVLYFEKLENWLKKLWK